MVVTSWIPVPDAPTIPIFPGFTTLVKAMGMLEIDVYKRQETPVDGLVEQVAHVHGLQLILLPLHELCLLYTS